MTHKFVQYTIFPLLVALLPGCAEGEGAGSQPRSQDLPPQEVHLHDTVVAHTVLGRGVGAGAGHVRLGRPVQQLGLWITGRPGPDFGVRSRGLDGVWSDWVPAEITWQEGELGVGRVFLLTPAMEVEYRGHEDLQEVQVEYHERILADPLVLARELPLEAPVLAPGDDREGEHVVRQALAPRELVIPRAEWGARDPGKVCGSPVMPYRASIHHTAMPSTDGGDPAARMRQMQAFHIDTRKWCDIGYHFVVSQSGLIYQGRSNETHPGAHVGNQNDGNIGVSFIGNYEVDTPPRAQIEAGQKILEWIRTTYTRIPWDRQSVRGHTEWPEQSSSCPGKHLLARIPELMKLGDAPVPVADIGLSVSWSPVPMNFNASGSSAMIPDLFPGDTLQAEVLLTNRTPGPLREVKLQLMIEEPYLRATRYTIYSDSPGLDQKSWRVNDADAAPGNPPKDALGTGATLDLYAMGAGETKRVLIDLEAAAYSVGELDHPDVRAWVRSIDGVYGEQVEWDQKPVLNTTKGDLLQAFAQLDVLATDQWQFDGGQATDFEGWLPCGTESTEQIKVTTEGALALNTPNPKGCLESPPWTKIDASRWDMVVLRPRAFDGAHTMVFEWAREGDTSAQEHRVGFALPGDGGFGPVVLNMKGVAGWTGSIARLRLWPRANVEVQGQAPGGWYELDALFFQRSDTSITNSAREDFVSAPAVAFLEPGSWPGSGATEPGTMGNPAPGDPADPAMNGGGTALEVDEGGCAQAGSPAGAPAAPVGVVLLGMLGLGWRRRHRA